MEVFFSYHLISSTFFASKIYLLSSLSPIQIIQIDNIYLNGYQSLQDFMYIILGTFEIMKVYFKLIFFLSLFGCE